MGIINVNFQTGQRVKDDPIPNSPNHNHLPLFHRADYSCSSKCKNPTADLCVKCEKCGRRFKNGQLIGDK